MRGARRVGGVLTLCLAVMWATHAPASEVSQKGYSVILHFEKDLSRSGKRFLKRDFRKYGYFSAMAVSSANGETTYGHMIGTSNRALAQQRALDNCARWLARNGEAGPCKLYAEIVPSGATQTYSSGKHTLSQLAARKYAEYLTYDKKPHKVFVFSPAGGWGFGKSTQSIEQATKEAIAVCEGDGAPKNARDASNWACRVFP